MNKKLLRFVVIVFCLYGNQSIAQTIEYVKLYDESLQLYESGNYDEAQKTLKRLLKKYPKETDALMLMGNIEMKKENWSKAKDWFADVTKIQLNHIDAFYKLGICDREDGIGRDIVTQMIMWKNSKKHFHTVILLDSTYQQVYYEYALLKRYQKEYQAAIDLCYKQLDLKPNNRDTLLGLLYFYDLFITYGGENLISMFGDADQAQIDWLKKRTGNVDIFFIGEKYRRQNKLNQADSIFSMLDKKHDPLLKMPLALAQIRLYYQMEALKKAEAKYFSAVNSISSSSDVSFLFEDIKYILEDNDLKYPFRSLEDIKSFYRNIWNRKNPLNSLEINYRLAEHYKRLIYCEKNYRYDGFRFPIHNPDRTHTLEFPNIFYNNKKFNHKGLVYLRYGRPDDTAIKVDANLPNNESWLYNATNNHPKYIFHFEVAEQAHANDWRLVPLPTNPEMIEARLGWDRYLDQYYMANTELDANSVVGTITIESVRNIRTAMNSEEHSWLKKMESIPINTSIAWFRNDEGKPFCDIYISAAANQIKKNENTDTVETGVALMDSTWKVIAKETHNSILESKIYNQQFIEIFTVQSPPVKAYLNSHVSNQDKSILGGSRTVIAAKEFKPAKMSVSDLVMAFSVEPAGQYSPFTKHGLEVIPNPSRQAKKDSLIYFYYEIYNLNEIDGQSRYSINQTITSLNKSENIFQKFTGLFSSNDEQSISISKEHQTRGSTAYEYTAFDFSSLSAGQVEIKIKVKDLNSGKVTETSTTFTLL
ncbi:MAG: tetratricopeptide repeat protein [Calditrichaceae bacterium]|nr:tetratricopeptide repeat protein [Calditrichaceae bacterium]